jgi:hypothetical protein
MPVYPGASRFPVDVRTVQNSAFLCRQTLSVRLPARLRRSDTQFQCLSARNNRRGSSQDIAGDNPLLRRNVPGNHYLTSLSEPLRSISGRRCERTSGGPADTSLFVHRLPPQDNEAQRANRTVHARGVWTLGRTPGGRPQNYRGGPYSGQGYNHQRLFPASGLDASPNDGTSPVRLTGSTVTGRQALTT